MHLTECVPIRRVRKMGVDLRGSGAPALLERVSEHIVTCEKDGKEKLGGDSRLTGAYGTN